jgi:hypothetical protein
MLRCRPVPIRANAGAACCQIYERGVLPAGVADREVDLPLISGVPETALPATLDRLSVSRDLADEALVEARGRRGRSNPRRGLPHLPHRTFETHHEHPLDPSRVEVVHRLRPAIRRAADDRDVLGHSRGLALERKTANSPRRSIFASWESFIGGSDGISPSPCHSPMSGSSSFTRRSPFRRPHPTARPPGVGPPPAVVRGFVLARARKLSQCPVGATAQSSAASRALRGHLHRAHQLKIIVVWI